MSTNLTVRGSDPAGKYWLRRQARRVGVSMLDCVRHLIREKRKKSERPPKPSDAFARYFGERHGVELPNPKSCGYRPHLFSRAHRK